MITPDVQKRQKLPVDYGALVRGSDDGPAVTPGSPADKAGIVAEDIILELNGKKIDKNYSLGAAISRYNVGDSVTVKIKRGEKELDLTVVLAKRPQTEE